MMGTRLRTACLCLVLEMLIQVQGKTSNPLDVIFPEIVTLELGGYETHVEMTAIDQKVTLFVEEYHDVRRKISVLKFENMTGFFFKGQNQAALINGDTCDVRNSPDPMADCEFSWRWLDDTYHVIGPSAILWKTPGDWVYAGTKTVRGILCDKFTGKDDKDDVKIEYFFSASNWLPGTGINLTVPVRVLAKGFVNQEGQMVPVDLQYDFTRFQSTLPDRKYFNIPLGRGCKGLKTLQSMPPIEEQFSFVMENFDEFEHGSFINTYKVWYDGTDQQMVRMDRTSTLETTKSVTQILDYVTGVEYLILNTGNCSVQPIFFGFDGSGEKSLKSPRDFFYLDAAEPYYAGKHSYRGIECDVWETVTENNDSFEYQRTVSTYFFTSSEIEEITEGVETQNSLVAWLVTLYNNNGVTDFQTTNYFRFNQADLRPFHEYMNVEACFTEETQKNYFKLIFPSTSDKTSAAQKQHRQFQTLALRTLADKIGARPFRFPYFKIFYEPSQISILGLMVNRPSYITGFLAKSETRAKRDIAEISPDDEECAKRCFEETNFKCRSIMVCDSNCSLSEKTNDFLDANQESCRVFIRAVEPSAISDSRLEDSMNLLQRIVQNGTLTLFLDQDTTFKASKVDFNAKPSNMDDEDDRFVSVVNDRQLVDATKSSHSYVVPGQVGSAQECYEACNSEGSVACATFSYCVNTKVCIFSTKYLKFEDLQGMAVETEVATSCEIYRKLDLRYFDLMEGKLPQLKGFLDLTNIQTTDECASSCRTNENCKSFVYCDRTRSCELYKTHQLDGFVPVKNSDQKDCRHYSQKFIMDYEVVGNNWILVQDPDQVELQGSPQSLETCAKTCSDQTNGYGCTSFNFCESKPGDSDSAECTLTTQDIFKGNPEKRDNCAHYFRLSAVYVDEDEKVFFPFNELMKTGFEARVEINMPFTAEEKAISVTIYLDEYHDFVGQRGKIHMDRDSYYYFNDTQEVVTLTGMKCTVEKYDKSNFFNNSISWGWNSPTSVIGPSAILFRDTVKLAEWVKQKTVRGIECQEFTAEDKLDPTVIITYCVTELEWGGPNNFQRVPVEVTAKGTAKANNQDIPVDFSLQFTYFRPDIKSRNVFMIPKGIGCDGLSIPDKRVVPKIRDQFSFVAEIYDVTNESKNVKNTSTVFLYKLWYDGLNKITKVIGNYKNEPFTEIQDFNTGVNYHFNENGNCKANSIADSFSDKSFGGLFGSLTTILKFNANYYYIGQDFQRGVYCDIWEKVRMNERYFDVNFHKTVYTYYFGSSLIDSITDGDRNIQVPVALQISFYIFDFTEQPLVLEFNFFRVDQPLGRTFYDVMNIEDCFLEETQKNFFTLFFTSTPKSTEIAKSNHKVFEIEAIMAIQNSAKVSQLRIPQINVYYEPTRILVQGLLLEKSPVLTGFFTPNVTLFPPTTGDIKEKNVENPEECAQKCIFTEGCAGFTVCQIGDQTIKDCYLTKNNGSSMKWTNVIFDRDCRLYMKSVSSLTITEAPLNQAIELLSSDAKAGKIQVLIYPKDQDQIIFLSNDADVDSNPFSFEDSENYENIQGGRQLDEGSQTTKLIEDGLISPRQCYARCLKEDSMECSSFSYCSVSKKCRFSSIYVDKDDTAETEIGTNCAVYRKEALMFFTQYEGQVPQVRGNMLIKANTDAECAHNCRTEKTLKCRGFEFCSKTKDCILTPLHVMNISQLVDGGSPTCSFYSMQYGIEFGNMGRVIIVDPNAVTIIADSFQDCAKTCYEWEVFDCRSVNYCERDGDAESKCVINTMSSLDPGAVTNSSDTCKHYFKKNNLPVVPPSSSTALPEKCTSVLPPSSTSVHHPSSASELPPSSTSVQQPSSTSELPPSSSSVHQPSSTSELPPSSSPEIPTERNDGVLGVSNGSFAGVLVGMLLVGIFLGVGGYLLFKYYRSNKTISEGMSLEFIRREE